MTHAAAIQSFNLSRSFGKLNALEDVSFEINPGESVALVGPNGAGKSTLIKICLGLLKPSGGRVGVLGQEPGTTAFGHTKRRIGFLPEQVRFHGSLTGRQTLKFYKSLKGDRVQTVKQLLDRVHLSEAADRIVSTYSKGMLQRLGLAQALLGEPKLLLLDEPMTGLDPEARANFFRILDEEKAKGAAIVLSSHILTELEARTDRVAVLSRGQLKAIGSVSDLRQDLGLSSRIRVHAARSQMQALSHRLTSRFDPNRFVNGVAILECGGSEKMQLLKEILGSGIELDDIEIVEPSLENIFAAYTAGGNLQ